MGLLDSYLENKVKLLKLKDDIILFVKIHNDTTLGIFTTKINILCRSGREIEVVYITSDRLYFHEGMFPAYLGSKRDELAELTFLDFVKELSEFGANSGFNTNIKY